MNPAPEPPVPATENPAPAPWRWALLRRAVTLAIFSYTVSLTLLFLAMEVAGERWWPLAILLYLPQRLYLLPLLVLIPAALMAEVSLGAYAMLAGSLIIFLWHVPFYPGMRSGPGGVEMKLITNNYAENHGLRIQPFIDSEDPDFVALEDAAGRGPVFQRSYPGRTVVSVGQFVFISRVPVKSMQSLEWPTWLGKPVAAVFEVPWQGEDLDIYAVHLPTPRRDFAKLRGLGLLRELAGRNRQGSDNMSFGEAMTARVQLARDLAGVLAREQRPFVAAGDFNMPPNGGVYRIVSWGLADCFAQAGRGFGFTFPCDTSNPLTFGGPWLRIDYILGGPGWHAEQCGVETGRRSKHRAVVATLTRD